MDTWTICTIISLLLLGSAIFLIIRTGKHKLGIVFGLLMMTGFVSYFPTYFEKYDIPNAVLGDIINLMQIVTLNSNTYETYQPTFSNPLLFCLCNFVRGCVHLAAPFLFAFATFTFIKAYADKRKTDRLVKNKKRIYIFSSMNEKAQKLVLSLAEHTDRSTAAVFYETDRIDSELAEQLGAIKVSHFSHKMKLDVQASKLPTVDPDKCELYFILLNDSDENIELGLCLESYYSSKVSSCNNIHMIAFSENSVSDEAIIDSINTSLDLRVINVNRILAYHLMTHKPLYESIRNKTISVLISGEAEAERELLFAVLICGQIPDITLKIHIITENAGSFREYLKLYYPEVLHSDYQILISEGTPDNTAYTDIIHSGCADATYVILCDKDDNRNVQTAVILRRFFLADDGKFTHKPVIAARIRNALKADVIKQSKYEIEPFGCDDTIYSYPEIADPELEALAKRVHFAYCGIPEEPDEKICLDALRSYYELEYNRKSSVAMALSIRYQLFRMGFCMKKASEPNTVLLRQFLDTQALNVYAEAEHKRWLAYLRTEGNRKMSVQQAEAIAKAAPELMKKLGSSVYLGMHADMVPAKDITSVTKEINDRCKDNAIFAPKKDTAGTDEFIIKAFPDILGNTSWQRYTGGYVYEILPNSDIANERSE